MKKRWIGWILGAALAAAVMGSSAGAQEEKSFVYGTTGYSEEMGDAGLNPHDNYSGWSAIRYGVGETLFKYNDNMEVEPWLATDYEFIDDTTVEITLRDGVQFSSGRAMDAQAVKECLEHLVEVHDRAPYDLKIDHIEAEGLTLTIYTTEPCPAIIHYLGDPYGAIIDMEYGIQGEGGTANVAGTGPYIAESVTPTQIAVSYTHLCYRPHTWYGEGVSMMDALVSFLVAVTAGVVSRFISKWFVYLLAYRHYSICELKMQYTKRFIPPGGLCEICFL